MYYGYIRGSTNKQVVTLDSQRERIQTYCKGRSLEMSGFLEDEATSSEIPLLERPQGRALAGLIAEKKVRGVVVVKLDRAFRSTSECLSTLEMWEKKKVELHVLDFGGMTIDTNSNTGKLIFTMFAAIAEWERGVIRERTRDALQFKQAHGQRVTRPDRVPYGYRVKGDRDMEPCPEEEAVIKEIMELSGSGLGSKRIRHKLQEKGITFRGGEWHEYTIRRIIERMTR